MRAGRPQARAAPILFASCGHATGSSATATPRRTTQPVDLEPVKAELLEVLSRETGMPRAALLCEAVDDPLAKYLRLARARSK